MERSTLKVCKCEAKKNKNKAGIITTAINTTKKTEDQVKLAAVAIRVEAKLKSADMPLTMQEYALCFTRSFLDAPPPLLPSRLNPSQLASALKKEFDTKYGAAWHCVVGKSFGSYITHSKGGFLYFSFDSFFVLLFQTRLLPFALA